MFKNKNKKKNTNKFQTTLLMFVCVVLFLYVCFLLFWSPRENLLVGNQPRPSYHIVVAKYKEDVSWFSHMEPDKLYVYDKSGDKNSPYTPLENKGREGSTFLGHIVKYYDHLPDYLIFVQGNPFPHMRPEITPENFQQHINRLIDSRPVRRQPLFCKYHEEPSHMYHGLLIDQYIRSIFNTKPKGTVRFAAGNQYIIPRKDILKRPKAFYQKLCDMAIKGDHYDANEGHNTPKKMDKSEIIGWSLERIFDVIISDVPINKRFLPQ